MIILQALQNPIFDSVILLFICVIFTVLCALKRETRRERQRRIVEPIVPIVPVVIT